jgi:hypothetical protein
MALGLDPPLAEMSTRKFLRVERGRRVRLTTSSPSVSRLPRSVVFNLGYTYPRRYAKTSWGYAKTSYGVCKINSDRLRVGRRAWFPTGGDISIFVNVQTGSEPHRGSYPADNGGILLRSKADWAWSWLTIRLYLVERYLDSLHTLSYRVVRLSTAATLPTNPQYLTTLTSSQPVQKW